MKPAQDLLQERKTRIRRAIALEKNDRTPVILMMDAFCARQQGVLLADFTSSLERAHEVMLAQAGRMGDFDAMETSTCAGPLALPLAFMSGIRMPGRELPPDAMWQIDEAERLSIEDYDRILAQGWPSFFAAYMKRHFNTDVGEVYAQLATTGRYIASFEANGYAVYTPTVLTTVTDALAGGRSMSKFMRDLYKIPDKVEAVLDVMLEAQVKMIPELVRRTRAEVLFVSPARGASAFFAPRLWERFIWKYLKGLCEAIIAEGVVANIHADGNWERDLDFFRSLPRGKFVFEADHGTDMRKLKEKLGDWCCIKGDVPAALLSCSTPDEVYDYCVNLMKDMGDGHILASGCSIPDDAKFENVRAMVSAAAGQ